MTRPTRDAGTPRLERSFTLIELLVVVSLLSILLAVAVPAFSSLLESNERALADSKLKIAASLGRDAAVRSGRGSDGAVAFFYAPGGRLRAVPFVKVGVIEDEDPSGNPIERDVFVQVDTFEAIEFPRGWSVRGYAPAYSTDEQWYERTVLASDRNKGNWVFPETHLYDPRDTNGGDERQTFLIRFDAVDGTASVPKARDALLLDPSTSRRLRDSAPFSTFNIERASSHLAYVRSILQLPPSDSRRRELLGDVSPDTVLARQVTQVVLYDETRLAGALRVRLDRDTQTIYRSGTRPELVAGVTRADIMNWLEGRNVSSDGPTKQPDKAARVYFVERYSGSLREMFP
ncbi:MAG: prepilin-type N-terminal cleavage/methylation domain-containing protein [Phycisphaeraceae bacterium]|nr:prepilin-type N-terminal cleavage/methylation domain-containing protein [Phycisphaeraceae bacterium]MCW5768302.1 prepilin-type N-terminal cleavage/methylation domain-containing protein [Phycisphaeraceae bacterium]